MLIRASRHERRQRFALTCLAAMMEEGTTLRAAFRRINADHVRLANTFPSVEAFETWFSRHRKELQDATAEIFPIPSEFEDGQGLYEGGLVRELPDHVRLRDTPHPSTERQERRERQEAERRIAAELVRELGNNPSRVMQFARRLAHYIVADSDAIPS